MTLGPAILALAWFESTAASTGPRTIWERLRNAFVTFGRVPLFFYLLQWPTAHGISVLLHLAIGKPVRWLFQTPIDWQSTPQGIGFNLGVVYLSWIAGVLLLYPVCKWFARVKLLYGIVGGLLIVVLKQLFISENTVKTHSSRLLDKLSAKRRTQAVQLGKQFGLIP